MRNSCLTALVFFSILAAHAQPAADSSAPYKVSTKNIAATLSANGEIVSLTAGSRQINLSGRTTLDDCSQVGPAKVEQLAGGAVAFTRTLRHGDGGQAVTVLDRFLPTADSVRWEIEIVSDGDPWTTPIITEVNYPATPATRFWTAWSDPVWTQDTDTDKHTGPWTYPLVFEPLRNMWWTYGGRNTSADHIVLPMATLAEPADDFGLSIVFSPQDTILCNSRLTTTQAGAMRFSRPTYRLGGGKAVRFEMDLITHEADWRGGLRWLTARYPEFFQPPNPHADMMAGCAAYSGDEDPIDVAKFKKMSFRLNWKLCDDCPYLGMYIPPVTNADETWERQWSEEPDAPDKPHTSSARQLNNYALYLRTNGFFLLDYFNVSEFGRHMTSNGPMRPANDPELWKDPRAFLATQFPTALLSSHPGGYGTWVVDFGDPAYQKFLLEQVDRDIRWLPDSAGICIDRTDYLQWNNTNADDGVSWVNGRPVRSMCVVWNELLPKLGRKYHDAGRVVFASPLYARLDVFAQVDGIYDEFAYDGRALNGSALMGMDKPVSAWSYNESVYRPDPDSFFQRHMLMGAFPTAPYPWNNHCIIPDMSWDDFYFSHSCPLLERDTGHKLVSTEKYFLAYGPLLDAIRGKKWVLTPHCVDVVDGAAKANLFHVPGGYALPVCFGGTAEYADVMIRNIPDLDSIKFSVLHPGDDTAAPLTTILSQSNAGVTVRVPLVRGCAMVTWQR